jgi:hypothetical protein
VLVGWTQGKTLDDLDAGHGGHSSTQQRALLRLLLRSPCFTAPNIGALSETFVQTRSVPSEKLNTRASAQCNARVARGIRARHTKTAQGQRDMDKRRG